MKKVLNPDAATNGSVSTTSNNTQTRHISNLPVKDADLLNVSETVNAKWLESNFVTLAWKTQTDFAVNVESFKKELESRNTAGGMRNQQTDDLENLDKQIEDAVPFVKTYIAGKFGPHDAPAHYEEFGIVHRGKHYEMPEDRQKRKDALRMMAEAATANGFDNNLYGAAWWQDIIAKYDAAWWQDIIAKYDAALTASSSGSATVSGHVSSLVLLRTVLRSVLHSILLVLEANYPDTFEQVRREWGFQKEKY